MPERTMINSPEVDPHNDGGCYLAATRYKLGDYTPYLFHTTDYGATWRRIDCGIPRDHFTRVIRVDTADARLLYAGTESGMYVSFDGGGSWDAFRQNMPVVPVTDIALKGDDVVVATQGRSLYVMEDAAPVLRKLTDGLLMGSGIYGTGQKAYLLPTSGAYVTDKGVRVRFVLPDSLSAKRDTVRVAFRTRGAPTPETDFMDGVTSERSKPLRVYSTHPDEDAGETELEVRPGSNELVWNMRGADAKEFDGMILWWADMRGPRVPAGEYEVELSIDPSERALVAGRGFLRNTFSLRADRIAPGGDADLEERYRFYESVIAKVSEAHAAIAEVRTLREQVKTYTTRLDTSDAAMAPLRTLGQEMDSTITKVE